MTKPSTVPSPYRNGATKLGVSILPLMDLGNPLWKAVGTYAIADMVVGFVISITTGSHVHLDLIGTGAFALASLPNIASATTASQKWSSIAVSIWGMKLATFLFYRATKTGHDARLTDTLSSVSGTFGFWFVTFMWNVCCSLPYLLGLLSDKSNQTFVQIGGLIFAIGLGIETLADGQKWWFKQSNPGQFCNVGLWAMSQHPNFFGNLVLWSGILIMNIPALILPASTSPASLSTVLLTTLWKYHRLALALISPVFMWGLFYGQATGLVTNAKQLAESKYGDNPEFKRYTERVPVIIPKLW